MPTPRLNGSTQLCAWWRDCNERELARGRRERGDIVERPRRPSRKGAPSKGIRRTERHAKLAQRRFPRKDRRVGERCAVQANLEVKSVGDMYVGRMLCDIWEKWVSERDFCLASSPRSNGLTQSCTAQRWRARAARMAVHKLREQVRRLQTENSSSQLRKNGLHIRCANLRIGVR